MLSSLKNAAGRLWGYGLLGKTFSQMSAHPYSIFKPNWDSSFDQFESRFTENNSPVINTTFEQLNAKRIQMLEQGKLQQSFKLGQVLAKGLRNQFGDGSEQYQAYIQELGFNYISNEQYDAALEIFLELSAVEQNNPSTQNMDHLTTVNQIAYVLGKLQKNQEAIIYLRECLRIAERLDPSQEDIKVIRFELTVDLIDNYLKIKNQDSYEIVINATETCIKILQEIPTANQQQYPISLEILLNSLSKFRNSAPESSLVALLDQKIAILHQFLFPTPQ